MDQEPWDKEFIGVETLRKRQAKQLGDFEGWAADGSWLRFHQEHYDWWSFPVDEESAAYGNLYRLPPVASAELARSDKFLKDLARSAELVALSFGWDLKRKLPVEHPEPHQAYDEGRFGNHGMRLRKMLLSLRMFGLDAEFTSLSIFTLLLREDGRLLGPQYFDGIVA
jgi:hypothetical protein